MKHALVIGGTGMLKAVCVHLLNKKRWVSVIGRTEQKISNLNKQAGSLSKRLLPLKVDYTMYNDFQFSIEDQIKSYGEIDLAICWIHSTAPKAPLIIADILNQQNLQARYLHVIGTATENTSNRAINYSYKFMKYENLSYESVVLGHQIENGKKRWLSDHEISEGVIKAIEGPNNWHTVGIMDSS